MSAVSDTSPSVLIVRLDAVGDALALVPLIAALRRLGMRTGAVLRPANAEVFSRRALDERYVAEYPMRDDSPRVRREIANLAARIAQARYAHALIATEDAGGYRLAHAAGIPQRVGFENGWGKPFKTLWVRRLCTRTIHRTAGLDPGAPHECEVLFALGASLLGPDVPSRDPAVLRKYVIDEEPLPDDRVAMQISDKWERLGARMDDVVELSQSIARHSRVRYIAARSEDAFTDRFCEAANVEVERFEQLAPWKSAIAAARAVVAPDSGALHVAGMVGTPVVGAFPDADFTLQTARWSPWAAPHRLVRMEGAWPVVAADALEGLISGRRATYTG